jgi:uncharacterized protein (TIGR02145 family)
VITWANPAGITFGTILGMTQLNATVDVPGTFLYTPTYNSILNIGAQNLTVDFIPYDGYSYSNTTKTVTINVTAPVTDIEGNKYNTVTIGTQVWMAQNLKTKLYNNGDLIQTTSPATLDISGESAPKYQWAYNGVESNVAIYGRLYTWATIADARKVCPVGWHIPSSAEWTNLINYLGGESNAGNKLKEIGTTHWRSYGTGTNESGFGALPAGSRSFGEFVNIGIGSGWISSTLSVGFPILQFVGGGVNQGYLPDEGGYSVRCLKDN